MSTQETTAYDACLTTATAILAAMSSQASSYVAPAANTRSALQDFSEALSAVATLMAVLLGEDVAPANPDF